MRKMRIFFLVALITVFVTVAVISGHAATIGSGIIVD